MPSIGACVVSLEAIRENQIVAVLLHRVDEELLHRNLLHSNTSLFSGAVQTAKMNYRISKLARGRGGLALKCGYYSTRFCRKKVG